MKLAFLSEDRRWNADPSSPSSQVFFKTRNQRVANLKREIDLILNPVLDGWHRVLKEPDDNDLTAATAFEAELKQLANLDIRYDENEIKFSALEQKVKNYIDKRTKDAFDTQRQKQIDASRAKLNRNNTVLHQK